LSFSGTGRAGMAGPPDSPAAASEAGRGLETDPCRGADGAAMSPGTIHHRLLAGLVTLCLIGGCAWIPSGGQRAEFAQTPDIAQKLSAARGEESLTARLSWPNNRWWL